MAASGRKWAGLRAAGATAGTRWSLAVTAAATSDFLKLLKDFKSGRVVDWLSGPCCTVMGRGPWLSETSIERSRHLCSQKLLTGSGEKAFYEGEGES